MKPSQYNHFIPLENGEYIVYNTMSGAIAIVDDETKRSIEEIKKMEAELSPEVLYNFKESEFVVHDDENELLKARDRYNENRYDPQKLSFVLTPTARCNLSCQYCYQRVDDSLVKKEDQTSTMSESTLRNVLLFVKRRSELFNATRLPITFYGGEPLIVKPLVFRILANLSSWSREHSITLKVGLYTNGTLLDQSFIDELSKYTITYVRMTLDGPQEIHDQFRHFKNGEGTYEHIVTNIGKLVDAGINVVVHININKYYKRIPELMDDLKERGLTKIHLSSYPIFDLLVSFQEAQKAYGLLNESFPIPESSFAVPFKEIAQARMYVFRSAFKKGSTIPQPHLGSWVCRGATYHHYAIDPSGDVYKCVGCMLVNPTCIGSIRENGHFERYPFLYEWMNTNPTYIEHCQSCYLLPTCGGGCIQGRILAKLPYFCEIGSFSEDDYIKMYLKQKYPEKLKCVKIE